MGWDAQCATVGTGHPCSHSTFCTQVIFKASPPRFGWMLPAQDALWRLMHVQQGRSCWGPAGPRHALVFPLLHAAKVLLFFPQLLLRRKLGGSCCIRSGVSGSRAGSLEAWSHSGRASSMSLLCSYASSCSPLVCLQKCDLPELERKGGLI